jgi:plastocyanin
MFYRTSFYRLVMLAKAALTILLIGIIGLTGIVMISPIATAQSATTNSTITTSTTTAAASSSNKIFYLFTAEHNGVNQTKLGIPPDTFSPDILEVNTGDNVIIHFYNLDASDSHTFTVAAPYNIDKIIAPGQNATFKFKAADEGIFRFYCRLHQPTMTGELIILPAPPVEKTTTAAVTK